MKILLNNIEIYLLLTNSKRFERTLTHETMEIWRLSKLAKWESLTKRATTHWRTRRKHRVSSEWINNRMALVRSKYCQGTLPLPFDPLRLIFFITPWIVCLNKQHVSLHVSLAKQTLLSSTRIRFVSLSLSLSLSLSSSFFREASCERIEIGLRSQFHVPIVY